MIIYDNKGNVILDIEVADTSVRYKAIKGENTLTLKYSLPEHIEVPIGSYAMFKNETYILMSPEDLTLKHRRNFEYSLVMYSEEARAKRYKFVNPIDKRLKFTLTAKPIEHLQMFVDNMNARDGRDYWKVGYCPDHVEVVLSYNHTYCHDALVQLADELELDYWFEGHTVNLGKLELNKNNPLPLSYGGDGQGLKADIKRNNYNSALPIEVLYVQGSETNIDLSKYGSAELHLPASQTIGYDGENFEGETGFDASKARYYKTDENGYYIVRADKDIQNNSEDSLDCTEIYPTKEETVESVIEVDKEKHFYDLRFKSDVDYSKYVIEGEKATIIFQSGMLAGKEFDLATDTDGKLICKQDGEYKRVEIVPQSIDGITMPDPDSGYMPNAGESKDTFKVFNIQLPDEYISGAEWDMFKYAVKHLYANEEPQYTITGTLDEIYAKRNWVNIGGRLQLGNYISFSDKSFQAEPILIRIIGIKEYVNKPYSPVIEFSNQSIGSTLVGAIKRVENEEAHTEELHKQNRSFTQRRFRSAQETLELLQAAFTNFSEGISPVTVRTMAMLVGDESLQFKFTASRSSLADIPCPISYDESTKQVTSVTASLIHMTLGIDAVTAPGTMTASDYMGWDIPAFNSAILEDGSKSYYVYVKASSSAASAEIILSATAIGMEEVSGYYHFLVGILNSEYNGSRDFVTLYGFTEVLPGQITTDTLRSGNGNLIIDLVNAVITAKNGATIQGSLKITSGSEGLENLSEWSSKQTQINTANTNATQALADAKKAQETADIVEAATEILDDRISDIDGTVAEINARLDGVVENYFEEGAPAIDNYPVSEWKAASEDDDFELINHVGDTYTNINEYKDENGEVVDEDAGKSWRWCWCDDSTITDKIQVTDKEGNTRYLHWHPIADSDAVKALLEASKAQTTADGKSRTFVTQPVPPYKEGDLWVQGASGEIMRCKDGVDKTSGSYDASDWEKASKYTDDTKANAAQSAADSAKARMDGWVADGVFTRMELQSLKEERTRVIKDFEEIEQKSLQYGGAQEYDTYRAKYNAYKLALDSVVTSLASIETCAIPALFETKQTEYYETRMIVLNYFTYLARTKTETAQTTANNAKTKLENWASDSLISPTEILGIEEEKMFVGQDSISIIADAEKYSVPTDAFEDARDYYYAHLTTILSAYEALSDKSGTVELPQDFKTDAESYYEQRTAILDLIAQAQKAAIDEKAKVSDYEYLKNTFGLVTDIDGVVMSDLVAVKNDEEQVEAFLNGSDEYTDSSHGKLILAAGIPESVEVDGATSTNLADRSKEAGTRIYEDGTEYTNKLVLGEGCRIGGLLVDRDGIAINGCASGGVYSIYLNDETFELSRVESTDGYCSIIRDLKISNRDDSEAFLTIDEDRGDAIRVTRGTFGGLRTKAETISNLNSGSLGPLNHNVLFPPSGTYNLSLPDAPLAGQEYWIETMGANIILNSVIPIWYHYTGQILTTDYTISSRGVIRFKYYPGLIYTGSGYLTNGMWTMTWVEDH